MAYRAETEVKVASEAAESFVKAFYHAINIGSPIGAFYTSCSPRYETAMPPDISINGLAGITPARYEILLAEQVNPFASRQSEQQLSPPPPSLPPPPLKQPQRGLTNGESSNPSASGSVPSRAHYEVELVDCQIANPYFSLGDPPAASTSARGSDWEAGSGPGVGQRASLLAQVSGRMSAGRGDSVAHQNFCEVFVLVPNWDAMERDAQPRGARRWLIASQNFRAL